MQIQKRPSVGELIEHTDTGDTAAVKSLLSPMLPRERRVIGNVLDNYTGYRAGIHKVAVYHALQDYMLLDKAPSTTQAVEDVIMGTAEDHTSRLERVENAITSPEKVVVRNDRSVNLGETSSVLSGIYAAFYPYGATHKKDDEEIRVFNTVIQLQGVKKSIPVNPLLKGVHSADEVEEGSGARWAINQPAVDAIFIKWCEDLNRLNKTGTSTSLDKIIRKRHVMRIFNTYIDVISETESTFLDKNAILQSFISENKSLISKELASQLEDHKKDIRTCEDPALMLEKQKVLEKYHLAISKLFGDIDTRDKDQKKLLRVAFSMKI